MIYQVNCFWLEELLSPSGHDSVVNDIGKEAILLPASHFEGARINKKNGNLLIHLVIDVDIFPCLLLLSQMFDIISC